MHSSLSASRARLKPVSHKSLVASLLFIATSPLLLTVQLSNRNTLGMLGLTLNLLLLMTSFRTIKKIKDPHRFYLNGGSTDKDRGLKYPFTS